ATPCHDVPPQGKPHHLPRRRLDRLPNLRHGQECPGHEPPGTLAAPRSLGASPPRCSGLTSDRPPEPHHFYRCSTSQTWRITSRPVLASRRPAGPKRTRLTTPAWPRSARSVRPSVASRRRTIPSLPPVASHLPSALNAMACPSAMGSRT